MRGLVQQGAVPRRKRVMEGGWADVTVNKFFVHSCDFGRTASRNTAAFHVALWRAGRRSALGWPIPDSGAERAGQWSARLSGPLLGMSKCLAKPNPDA